MNIRNYTYEYIEIEVDREDTLYNFLEGISLSKRFIKRSYINKQIKINDKFIGKDKNVVTGDILRIYYGDETPDYEADGGDLNILYEDDNYLIIDKPPYEIVHPTNSHPRGTLLNKLQGYFIKHGIKRKVRLVNRLDMNTSGLLVVAKNSFFHQQLAAQMGDDTMEKYYIAVVQGIPKENHGIIEKGIKLVENLNEKKEISEDGYYSKTEYWLLDSYENHSLLKLRLHTGRTHQIRLHLSSEGIYILGDELYGEKSNFINRQALHSYGLSFTEPFNKKRVNYTSPLPEDITNLLHVLNIRDKNLK